jgi:outer membrane protein assembly factor BamA
LDSLFSPQIDLYTFYGYPHAGKVVSGVTMPYELNSRHKFFAQVSYRLSRVISVTGEAALRTGFAYTPTRSSSVYEDENLFSDQYYKNSLGAENSVEFPINATLNMHVNFNFGNSELFFSVANITNRSNPIINTSDGFIYDTGILPSVGFRWRF